MLLGICCVKFTRVCDQVVDGMREILETGEVKDRKLRG